jgi:hypothetical protein
VKTSEPGCSIAAAGAGVPGGSCFASVVQSTARSAVVTWPVATTKARNCAFVTSVRSIQNAAIATSRAGNSSGRASASLRDAPIRNTPLVGAATKPIPSIVDAARHVHGRDHASARQPTTTTALVAFTRSPS